jgi:hypothetical protein
MDEELTPKKEEAAKSILEQIKEERAAVEKATAEAKAEIERLEQLRAEQILGGGTNTGQPKEKPKEETPAEYAKRMLRNEQ